MTTPPKGGVVIRIYLTFLGGAVTNDRIGSFVSTRSYLKPALPHKPRPPSRGSKRVTMICGRVPSRLTSRS